MSRALQSEAANVEPVVDDKLLRVEDVAAWAQLEEPTIRREIRQGNLKAAKIAGKWRIRREHRDKWFDERLEICEANDSAVSLPGGAASSKTAFRQVSDSLDRRSGRPALKDVSAERRR